MTAPAYHEDPGPEQPFMSHLVELRDRLLRMVIAIVLGGFIGRIGGNLFVYIQTLYAFFAPPFSAVFLLGILWRRTTHAGALAAGVLTIPLSILIEEIAPEHRKELELYLTAM